MKTGMLKTGLLTAILASAANASVNEPRSSELTQTDDRSSDLSRFVLAHLPLTDDFEAVRKSLRSEVPSELVTDDFHMARFPGGEDQVTVRQLNEALEGCVPNNRMNANYVSITVHYSCPVRQRSRLVYNFENGRISRVLVGDIPQELRCSDGICIDRAER